MTQTVIPIQQHLDALVHHLKHLANIDVLDLDLFELLIFRWHLDKGKAAAQGDIRPARERSAVFMVPIR